VPNTPQESGGFLRYYDQTAVQGSLRIRTTRADRDISNRRPVDSSCRLVPSCAHPGAALCSSLQRKISNLLIFLVARGSF
jgi:hypothetical protein